MKFTGIEDKEFSAAVEAAHAEALPKILELNCAFVRNGQIQQALADLEISLSATLRTRGGTAQTFFQRATGLIQLNYRLLKKYPDQIKDTYLHEFAHILANLAYGRSVGHSQQWKRVARAIGASDERCHQMDVSEFAYKRKPPVRYKFSCACRDWMLTKARLNKHLEYRAKTGRCPYSCPKCKDVLKLTTESLIHAVESVVA